MYIIHHQGMCTSRPGLMSGGHEGGGVAGGGAGGDPDTAAVMQFKPKRKLMTKFFNEPVDALDLRLANAEENLSRLPVDPFTDTVKQEVSLEFKYS